MRAAERLAVRVPGREAIPWSFVVPVAVVLVATPPFLDVTAISSVGAFGGWVVAAVAGSLALCLVLLVADRRVFLPRADDTVPLWWVAVAGAVAGLFRAVAMLFTAAALGLEVGSAPGARVIASVMLGALLTPATTSLASSIGEFRRRRTESIERLVALRADAAGRGHLADAMVDAVYAEVMAVTDEVRDHLDDDGHEMDMRERRDLAHRLRATVTDSLRPLSHRLYATRSASVPQARLSMGVRGVLSGQPLYPLLSAAFFVLLALVVIYARSVDPMQAAAWALAAGIAMYVALAVVGRLARVHDAVRRRALLVGLCAAVPAVVLVTATVDAAFGSSTVARPFGAMAGTAIIIAALTATGAAVRGTRAAALTLEEQADARTVEAVVANRELVRVSRDLAKHVHGTLQSHLLATAYALEGNAGPWTSGEVLARARAAFEADAAPRGPRASLDDEVHRRAGLWEGFMDVTVDIGSGMAEAGPALVADAGRVVEEALGNAHKHGCAEAVRIALSPADGGMLRIEVTDDGIGPRGNRAGLGSAWLDSVAPGTWSLEVGAGGRGATLRVDLPCAYLSSSTGLAAP